MTWVQSLGWKDPLEEKNGNPLQYSCLKNPTGRKAWWASPKSHEELDTTKRLRINTKVDTNVWVRCLI